MYVLAHSLIMYVLHSYRCPRPMGIWRCLIIYPIVNNVKAAVKLSGIEEVPEQFHRGRTAHLTSHRWG